MDGAVRRCSAVCAIAAAFVIALGAPVRAQGDFACAVDWFDPERFDAILRVELSQLAPDVVAGLYFVVTACQDAEAEIRVLRGGVLIERRTVDLVDVPNAARARLLALMTAELVRVAPLAGSGGAVPEAAWEDDESVPPSIETTSAQSDVETSRSAPSDVATDDLGATTAATEALPRAASRWGHRAGRSARWSLAIERGVRMFVSSATRQPVVRFGLTSRILVFELRYHAPQRRGAEDGIRFDGFDFGVGAHHVAQRPRIDGIFGVVVHVGLMRARGIGPATFSNDETLSYDIGTRLALERRVGRFAVRFGFDLAYVHGQRVVQIDGTMLHEAHGLAVTPFVSGALGSRASR